MKKILLIQTASIGDVILTTPVLEKLHHLFPEAKVDFLLKKGNEGLFAHHPFLNEVIVWDKSRGKYLKYLKILTIVRAGRYDLIVNFQRFASSGFLTAFSGAKFKAGFDKNPFSMFFHRKVRHVIGKTGNNVHEIRRNLELISHLGGSDHFPVKLYPGEIEEERVRSLKKQPYFCLSPTSLWYTKQYPPEKWIEFLRAIPADLRVFFLGSASDHEACQAIIALSGHPACLNLAGKLSFLESAALMKDAVMNFVNDSAPMHLASSVDAPVTAIFCSTVPSFGFGPLSRDSAVVEIDGPLYCRPCGLHGFKQCPEGHFRCALDIKKEQLLMRIPHLVHSGENTSS